MNFVKHYIYMELEDRHKELVISWLTDVHKSSDRSKTKVALADFCDVTRQDVTNWFRTGRITNTNLAKAAVFYGVEEPDFLSVLTGELTGQSSAKENVIPYAVEALEKATPRSKAVLHMFMKLVDSGIELSEDEKNIFMSTIQSVIDRSKVK